MKIDRLLSIIMLMIHREKVTAAELASYFEVSVRTIQRDIDDLTIAGIPIYSEVGKNGGYQLMEGYKMTENFISKNEMGTMISLLKGVSSTIDDQSIKTFFEKLCAMDGSINRESLENKKHEKIIFDIEPWGNNDELKNSIGVINAAIDKSLLIGFAYYDGNYNKSDRVVESYSLMYKNNSWYYYGYCLERKDYRLFKISRMFDLEIKDTHFEIRDSEELQEINRYMSRPSTEIKLKFSNEIKGRLIDYFKPGDIVEAEDGFIYLSCNFPIDEWVYSFILGYGHHVEVLEPQSVREEIIGRIKKISCNYNI